MTTYRDDHLPFSLRAVSHSPILLTQKPCPDCPDVSLAFPFPFTSDTAPTPSRCTLLVLPYSKPSTLLDKATNIAPRRAIIPLTRSLFISYLTGWRILPKTYETYLNSSSATACPAASLYNITLFGGYRGDLPPPCSATSGESGSGNALASVPGSSILMS